MTPHPGDAESRWSDINMKERRLERPSGWLMLTRDQGTQLLIEALIDGANREFNKTELADYAGVSRPTVASHIDLLLDLEVVEEIPETSPQRYRLDVESDVTQAILEVNGTVVKTRDELDH